METGKSTRSRNEAAAKQRPAWSCKLSPGITRVTWRDYPQATSVDIEWFDAGGNVVSSTTIPVTSGKPQYSQKTPAGAVEAGFRFNDANGTFAVGGGTCV